LGPAAQKFGREGILSSSLSAQNQTGPAAGIILPAEVWQLLAERRKRPRAPKPTAESRKPGNHSSRYGKILLFGTHRELALYRAEVLRHSGFSVVTPTTRQDALALIRSGDIDAVILSYTLAAEAVEELAEMVRQFCPGCVLITISRDRTRDRRIAPDAVVLAEDGPQGLLAALQRLLKRVQ
jgi:hypothetical protein